MAEKPEDLTIQYEEDGFAIVDELDREILTRGQWSTILFKYRQWNRGKESYSRTRYSFRRYRKISGQYRQQSKFNLSSNRQAKKVIETLGKWIEEEEKEKEKEKEKE